MPNSIYEDLRILLDKNVQDVPPAPEIIEILEILFTEEEANVALGLSFRGLPASTIAKNLGMDLDSAQKHLEIMANKGVIFSKKVENELKYSHLPALLLFENSFKRGIQNEMTKKLTPLWRKYLLPKGSTNYSENTSFLRIIPIQETIEQDSRILPYDKLNEMIDKAEIVGVTHCACRELEQKCDLPRETCMVFDDGCAYFVDRGMGRYLTKEEMKNLLKECEEAGLIHMVNNYQDKLAIICNCCACCCLNIRAYKDGHHDLFNKSAFLPRSIDEKCEGCGICADERCQIEAIKIVEDRPQIDLERCIGCSLCVTGCPNNAMQMERVAEVPEPFLTGREYGETILRDKGKMEKFLEVWLRE